MIILKVKQRGRIFTIPGIRSMRTPVEVDISNLDMNVILSSLHMCSIDDYEIIEKAENGRTYYYNKEKNIMTDKKLDEIFVNEEPEIKEDLNFSNTFKLPISKNDDLSLKLDNIESMLKDLLNDNKKHTKAKNISRLHKKEKIEDDPVDAFIPNVDIDKMKIRSDIRSIKKDSDNQEESIDLLSKIAKNNHGEFKNGRRKTKS